MCAVKDQECVNLKDYFGICKNVKKKYKTKQGWDYEEQDGIKAIQLWTRVSDDWIGAVLVCMYVL